MKKKANILPGKRRWNLLKRMEAAEEGRKIVNALYATQPIETATWYTRLTEEQRMEAIESFNILKGSKLTIENQKNNLIKKIVLLLRANAPEAEFYIVYK